jgi:hypothetical protein
MGSERNNGTFRRGSDGMVEYVARNFNQELTITLARVSIFYKNNIVNKVSSQQIGKAK